MRFLFVDQILQMEPGRTILASKFIRADEDYFQDHFPGFPVVPGVLLTEMMAQTAGKCLDAENSERGKSMLARITCAQFRAWVKPGQTAYIHGTVRNSRPQYATVDCRIEVEQKNVCSAELFFSFVVMSQFAPGYRDEVLERFTSRPCIGGSATGPAR